MGWVEVEHLPPNLMSYDDLLVIRGTITYSCQVPRYCDGVEGCSKGVCVGTHLRTNCEEDWQKGKHVNLTNTIQHKVEDIACLKLDAFQEEEELKDRWNDVQCGVI